METLLKTALDHLKEGTPCVFALILHSEKETPRGAGSMMLILPDGTIRGSVGGGPMEWAVMQKSRRLLAEDGEAQILYFNLGGNDTIRSTSICGGTVRLCLYLLKSCDLPTLEKFYTLVSRREKPEFVLWREGTIVRLICVHGGQATGAGLSDETAAEILRACREEDAPGEPRLLYREIIMVKPRLWLMGGGHVALATARVAAIAGFDVVVVDDRAEYANEDRFPGARCIVCEQYDGIPADEVTSSDYIAILTRGHRHDRESLAWALGTRACYVGMIGSQTKRALIYQTLMEQGVPKERLDWVHAPIGLPIGGHTPGDIAVSIVAELIAIRADMTGERTPHRARA